MSADLSVNSTSTVTKGTVIYEKGEEVQSVALILKGRVEACSDGVKAVLGSGNFLGMYDVPRGKHSFTYKALDDVSVYGLPICTWEQVCLLLDEKIQYRGLFVTSMNYFLVDLSKKYQSMKKDVMEMADFVKEVYEKCQMLAEQNGFQPEKLMSMERMVPPEQRELPPELMYYLEACRIPLETQKNYFAGNTFVAEKHAKEQSGLLPALLEGCRYYSEWLVKYLRVMVMDEKNLFSLLGRMILRVKQAGRDSSALSSTIDQMIARIDEAEKKLIEMAGVAPGLNRDKMESIYLSLLSDDTTSVDAGSGEDRLQELSSSLTQIMQYAPVHGKVISDFEEAIDEFLGLMDKFARAPEPMKLRKKIANLFFEIYEAVAKKSFDDSQLPLPVELFLHYGYVSEELLTEEELRALIAQPAPGTEDTDCRVYTLCQWLKAIYNGEKNPCKDEFDMNYEDHLRKELMEKKIDQKELNRRMEDGDAKVHFEVDNLMRYADRLLSGNLSAFVPVLCSESLGTKIENSIVTGEEINVSVRKVEKVDYSIFYREKLATYEKAEINRFALIERVMPDFILFPIYGRTGQMWQDNSGRIKTTPGRILMPILLDHDVSSEILKMMAHFRWEKCRSEMGADWNNYRTPSLTSEYTDYLQFFKKNSELTPDRKEKVKAQLQQCNNRHREVFTRDYQDWILREAAGAMKLNRVARGILFTYCPFASEITEGLIVQNSYQEAARRYTIERRNLEKSMTVMLRKFEKSGMAIPEEVEQTRKYLLET